MQIISGTTEINWEQHTAVAIGKFDGIHQGHRRLLDQIIRAKEDGLAATVFTFDPPPSVFFSGKPQAELTTKEEKRRIFDKMGIDLLVEFPMNARTAAMPPETFVSRVLHEQLKARYIAAGTDLSFGDRGKGDWHLLKAMAEKMGYQVQVIDKIMYGGREISSTFVREEILKGNMELAEGRWACQRLIFCLPGTSFFRLRESTFPVCLPEEAGMKELPTSAAGLR